MIWLADSPRDGSFTPITSFLRGRPFGSSGRRSHGISFSWDISPVVSYRTKKQAGEAREGGRASLILRETCSSTSLRALRPSARGV
ncbi:unnamed protein product [Cylicocyclus nassatus]|uniref:Uncharacterized protein n=1 Tax=Cylicocyclus nassatus TaxID=53992 RepID=A0AA36MFF9_CYLNA|nr:unnamed protein product [Cylicocyclus nassatus]